MNKDAVLFDLDGTLLDTAEGVLESVRYAVRRLGLAELPHDTMLKFVGPPIQNSFAVYYGVSGKDAQRAAEIFRGYYRERGWLQARLYPQALDVLRALRDRGVKIGVATYKREDYAIAMLRHFGIADFCASMHGADNLNRLTKADIIERCIEELGSDKDRTALVGDTKYDAEGAACAGIDFIAVTYGFGYCSPADVAECSGCIGVADSPNRILDYI